jgi:hypothetical protein
MAEDGIINVDLADVWSDPDRKTFIRTAAWGDPVTIKARTSKHIEVELVSYREDKDGSILSSTRKGYIVPGRSSGIRAQDTVAPAAANRVLKVNFVDVQQGDGTLIETPDGKVILVDGGENAMFARYLASRFRGTSAEHALRVDCIVVTHGDGDHFDGLTEIQRSETHSDPLKRLFLRPERVYHNGLVKRPGKRDGKSVPEKELLGPTRKVGGELMVTGLEDDLLAVPDEEMSKPFKAWKSALKAYRNRAPFTLRRIDSASADAFGFLGGGPAIEVLGPRTVDAQGTPGLPFLKTPSDSGTTEGGGLSASRTINGHSIVFRLVYGGFRFLFTGDLNDEAGRKLAEEHAAKRIDLTSEVLKTPHHGSADFSNAFLRAVSPVISVVSSGDDTARTEYIHPRATLVGALGRWSRLEDPLVFITELVAFFQTEGWSRLVDDQKAAARKNFFGFSRAAYGIVLTRTDGKRLLVFTNSANVRMKESYAFTLDPSGNPVSSAVQRA